MANLNSRFVSFSNIIVRKEQGISKLSKIPEISEIPKELVNSSHKDNINKYCLDLDKTHKKQVHSGESEKSKSKRNIVDNLRTKNFEKIEKSSNFESGTDFTSSEKNSKLQATNLSHQHKRKNPIILINVDSDSGEEREKLSPRFKFESQKPLKAKS